ncbi:HDOD domain-containing protein [Xylophilus sp. ASV27]|uniref:HDOD domain-containing protein n=1 Tax=Xylophilus sp. ASV27 TaxID=2795129 RepID=UPI0018EC2236|nr:HDOD domain-containing protein [Xylophilus sp. ASV27]
MTDTVLDSITLGYQVLWGPSRSLRGVALFARPQSDGAVDAKHLLEVLQTLLPGDAPPIFLVAQEPRLLADLLEHAQPPGVEHTFSTQAFFTPTLVVPAAALAHAPVAEALRRAQRRGLPLVWQGEAEKPPDPGLAGCFGHRWISVSPALAALALHEALRQDRVAPDRAPAAPPLPVGQIFEGIASHVLVDYCFQRCRAYALVGWPAEDAVHSLRRGPLEPDHRVVLATLQALEAERPADVVERTLCDDPLLAYRFLVYANSPGVGLRSGVQSIRHALMMLGTVTLAQWLAQQLPRASHATMLRPVKAGMVMRSRLMERLLDAGIEEALRREVVLCGLFSQLDLLLDLPLGSILTRLPLSDRLYDAIVLHSGPYAAALETTVALESSDTEAIARVCREHDMGRVHVNRALLRMVGGLHAE